MVAANPLHLPVDWDQILSTTMHNYRKEMTDNIFNSRPLLNYLNSNGRVRLLDGGVSIVEPIIYTEGETQTYAQWDPIDVTPQEGISAAQFQWKQMVGTIAISGLEEAQNNGKAAAINLIEAKIMQTEESLKNLLSTMLYASVPGVNDWHSLVELIDDVVAVGGIDPADPGNDFWKSGVTTATAVDAAGLEAAMRQAFNTASDSGSDRVDSIFAAQDVFEFYESTLTPQVRYTDVSKANLGFQNLMFKNVPMFWDFDAPAETMFGLNSKYIGLVMHSQRNFKQSPFTENLSGSFGADAGTATPGTTRAGTGLDARVAYISTYGNATVRNRRRCFKITDVSEA